MIQEAIIFHETLMAWGLCDSYSLLAACPPTVETHRGEDHVEDHDAPPVVGERLDVAVPDGGGGDRGEVEGVHPGHGVLALLGEDVQPHEQRPQSQDRQQLAQQDRALARLRLQEVAPIRPSRL